MHSGVCHWHRVITLLIHSEDVCSIRGKEPQTSLYLRGKRFSFLIYIKRFSHVSSYVHPKIKPTPFQAITLSFRVLGTLVPLAVVSTDSHSSRTISSSVSVILLRAHHCGACFRLEDSREVWLVAHSPRGVCVCLGLPLCRAISLEQHWYLNLGLGIPSLWGV